MLKLIFLLMAGICWLAAFVNIISFAVYLTRAKKIKQRLDSMGTETCGTVKVYKYVYAELTPLLFFLNDIRYSEPVRESIMTEFEADGKTVYYETMDYPSLKECTVGAEVKVTYDKENPSLFRIGSGRNAKRRGMKRIASAVVFTAAQIVLIVLAIVL